MLCARPHPRQHTITISSFDKSFLARAGGHRPEATRLADHLSYAVPPADGPMVYCSGRLSA